MVKTGGGPSSGNRPTQDTDFQSKLEEARARRMKVLAARGETIPAANPFAKPANRQSAGSAVAPTVMRNLRIATGQMPMDTEDDPDPEPVAFRPRSATGAAAPVARPGAAAAIAAAIGAPSPDAAPTQTPDTKPALSFSFVAVLLSAAGIGLAFDKDALDQLRGEVDAATATWFTRDDAPGASIGADLSNSDPAQAAAERVPDTAQPQGAAPISTSPPADGTSTPAMQVTDIWAAPTKRGTVQMPPLTGQVDPAPAATFEIAPMPGIGALTSIQQTIGALNESPAPAISLAALPIPQTALQPERRRIPAAMPDPGPKTSVPIPQVELASFALADPALRPAALLSADTTLAAPKLIEASAAILTTPAPNAPRRPLKRPVLLAVSPAPLARPEVDLSIPQVKHVALAEGQSGFNAARPLFVHLPSREEAALFDDLIATVRARVTPHTGSRPVPFKVSRSQVRYYHEQDRAAADAIAKTMGVWLHDMTDFRPAPKSGLIEIWAKGTNVTPVAAAPARQARQVRPPRRSNSQPAQAPAATTPQQPSASAVTEITATLRTARSGVDEVVPANGVKVRRVEIAPEASLNPLRRLFNALKTQDAATIEEFVRQNAD